MGTSRFGGEAVRALASGGGLCVLSTWIQQEPCSQDPKGSAAPRVSPGAHHNLTPLPEAAPPRKANVQHRRGGRPCLVRRRSQLRRLQPRGPRPCAGPCIACIRKGCAARGDVACSGSRLRPSASETRGAGPAPPCDAQGDQLAWLKGPPPR